MLHRVIYVSAAFASAVASFGDIVAIKLLMAGLDATAAPSSGRGALLATALFVFLGFLALNYFLNNYKVEISNALALELSGDGSGAGNWWHIYYFEGYAVLSGCIIIAACFAYVAWLSMPLWYSHLLQATFVIVIFTFFTSKFFRYHNWANKNSSKYGASRLMRMRKRVRYSQIMVVSTSLVICSWLFWVVFQSPALSQNSGDFIILFLIIRLYMMRVTGAAGGVLRMARAKSNAQTPSRRKKKSSRIDVRRQSMKDQGA